MVKKQIKSRIRELNRHDYIGITTRGNSAIKTALSILPENSKILIPEEGGWLSYQTLPKDLGLEDVEVKCDDARINLAELKEKLKEHKPAAFLYHNPGGYFAEQDTKNIYRICKECDCLAILDVSGSLGTEFCNGTHADILVGSFGKWKLVDAGKGGFISCDDDMIWQKIEKNLHETEDEIALLKILQKLQGLPERIGKLRLARDTVVKDLQGYEIVHKKDKGLVVVVKFKDDIEKEKVINYCKLNNLEWTECPRYIRLNKKAISIEIKRL